MTKTTELLAGKTSDNRAPGRIGTRSLAIAAELTRLPEVREFALRAAKAAGFDDEDSFWVTVAASEAAANAIEHGSSGSGDEIALQARLEDGALAFYVSDRGNFVPRVARGAMPERGRGLRTIGALMDDVDVRPAADGTVIRFSKRLSS